MLQDANVDSVEGGGEFLGGYYLVAVLVYPREVEQIERELRGYLTPLDNQARFAAE